MPKDGEIHVHEFQEAVAFNQDSGRAHSFKGQTDLALLYANIDPNLADRRFFIRKAIGWALRAYAWTDPSEVARYVREHEHLLSGLSRREALKNVPTALR